MATLSQRRICHPGDIWQCLETVWVVTTNEVLLVSGRYRRRLLLNAYDAQDSIPLPQTKNNPAPNSAPRLRRFEVEKSWGRVVTVFLASSLLYQAVPITGCCKRDNKMVASERNREMTIRRTTGQTWIAAPGPAPQRTFPKKPNSFS